ncbi:SDR family oxidoreductase [Shigella flexneri]
MCPGYAHTNGGEHCPRVDPGKSRVGATELAKAIPKCRLADPLEVGELAALLASDESSYLTGTPNVIDGGSTLPVTVSVVSDSPLFPPAFVGRISDLFPFQLPNHQTVYKTVTPFTSVINMMAIRKSLNL